jgi:8-oxo-dGTP diphosphatase
MESRKGAIMADSHHNPLPTVDAIIEMPDGAIVLIERKNPPYGWALPGGFVDYGESAECAVVREALEETCLEVQLVEQFYAYSDPHRDPRHHTISVVFIVSASGIPRGADDAKVARAFRETELPSPLVFDHGRILHDYFHYKKTGKRPTPVALPRC